MRNAARHSHRSGSRIFEPRRSACANASATASLAILGVAREGEQRPPHALALLPVDALEFHGSLFSHQRILHERILHVAPTGSDPPPKREQGRGTDSPPGGFLG